jgi:hypothetical protein
VTSDFCAITVLHPDKVLSLPQTPERKILDTYPQVFHPSSRQRRSPQKKKHHTTHTYISGLPERTTTRIRQTTKVLSTQA